MVGLLLAATPAHAASAGDLTNVGCINDSSDPPCAHVPAGSPAIASARQLVVAPGNTDAYVIEMVDGVSPEDALTHLRRAADGTLSYADCISDVAGWGCSTLPAHIGMGGSGRLAISPDGKDIYVAAGDADALMHFRVGTAGRPAYVNCWGAAANGCSAGPPTTDTDFKPSDVVVSPDGKEVYAAGRGSVRVATFARGGDGTLALRSCTGLTRLCDLPPSACRADGDYCRPTEGTASPAALALSPDGRALYVVSADGNGRDWLQDVAHFRRDTGGELHYADCVGAGHMCAHLPAGQTIAGLRTIAVSPDSRSVYVAGHGTSDPPDQAITHFRAAADGSLTWSDCVGRGANGCTRTPADVDNGSWLMSLQLSPDGGDLYGGAVDHLKLDSTGKMTFANCYGSVVGCWMDDLSQSADQTTTMTPDGRFLYVMNSSSIVTLARSATARAPAAGSAPTISLGAARNVETDSASMVGHIDGHGQQTAYEFQVGRTTAYELRGDQFANGSGGGAPQTVEQEHRWLRANTLYHYRLVARNNSGTTYSGDGTFTTKPLSGAGYPPNISESRVDGIGPDYATLAGWVNQQGQDATVKFEYGPTTSYGSSVAVTTPLGTRYAGDNWVTANVTGLQRNRTYHFRMVATGTAGTTRSADGTFFTNIEPTLPPAPALGAPRASSVASRTATVAGTVNGGGSGVRWQFDYGTTNSYGSSTSSTTVAGDAADHPVSAALQGLAPNTLYHYRLVVTSPAGTIEGRDATFRTTAAGTAPSQPQPTPSQPSQPQPTPSQPAQSPTTGTAPSGQGDAAAPPASTPLTPALPAAAALPPPLRVGLTATRQRLRTVIARGLVVKVSASRPAHAVATAVIVSGSTRWARAVSPTRFSASTKSSHVRIALPAAMRSGLRGARTTRLRVTVVATAADGSTGRALTTVRLRR